MKPGELFLTIQNCIAWTCADPMLETDFKNLRKNEWIIILNNIVPSEFKAGGYCYALSKFGCCYIDKEAIGR
jgi:hypothetical protein